MQKLKRHQKLSSFQVILQGLKFSNYTHFSCLMKTIVPKSKKTILILSGHETPELAT